MNAKASKADGPPPLTATVARFSVETGFADIPAEAVAVGKKNLLDTLATGIAGSAAPGSDILRRYSHGLGVNEGPASVIGSGLRLPPRFAAFLNGYSMHADDFDDTYQAETGGARAGRYGRMGVHPTAPVLAAVLAAAEPKGRSGRDVLTACLIGVEATCRAFDATDVSDIANGLHTTGTCGTVGAGAALANLAGIGVEEARQALGLAVDQAAGLLVNSGTMAKAYHSARAAEGAVLAADLAAMGFTASPIVLEAAGGYFQLEGGGFKPEPITRKLGRPFAFVERGVWLKPWPTGSLSHPAMTKTLELVLGHDLKPGQVKAIRVRTSKGIRDTLHRHVPKTRLEAKFSLEFCLAVLLLERKLGLQHFTDAFVNRREVQETLAKVTYTAMTEEEFRTPGYTLVTSFVAIDLVDGRTLEGRIDYGKGSKANPMSEDEVAEKFRLAAEYARLPKAQSEEALAMARRIEDVGDVRQIMRCLSGSRP
ncbi:MAG: MmgE/PrpD family protein [Proteobacteria bacterium]|nr:MmgE/PrpD family protein [Pseudomonadota bacterium]